MLADSSSVCWRSACSPAIEPAIRGWSAEMHDQHDPNEPFENLRPLDVLAIAAHPDDVEQTCGGTLIRMAELGYRPGVLDLTAGDMGSRGSPQIRVQESQAAAQHLLLAWRQN